MAMEGLGLIEWCKRRKAYLGMSNDDLAEAANIAPGTVARIMAGTYENFKYSSVRPLLQVLVGGEWGEHPCVDPEAAALSLKIAEENICLKQHIAEEQGREAEMRTDYRLALAAKDKAIRNLSIALAVAVGVLVLVLAVDALLPNFGWFRY